MLRADVAVIVAGARSFATELPEHFPQTAAVDVLHGVVMDALIGADGIDRHDVTVVQTRGRLRLVPESVKLTSINSMAKGSTFKAISGANEICPAS